VACSFAALTEVLSVPGLGISTPLGKLRGRGNDAHALHRHTT
jgi:hypothetical protein